MRLFRLRRITGWRRQVALSIRSSRGHETQTDGRQRGKPVRASSRRLLRVRADFVFPKLRLAVFVDGCFWHGCPKHGTQSTHNRAFWRRKLTTTKTRDQLVTRTLRRQGWRALRLWKHELARKNEGHSLKRIRAALTAPGDLR